MAITLLDAPQNYQPVYNPLYTRVQSTSTAQEGFNFLFDLYVNGTFVNRDKLLPRPATNTTIYSPARILESYVSSDMTQSLTGATGSINCIDKYKVIFGEEYIVYHNYDTIGLSGGSSYTKLTFADPHGYSVDDELLITQAPGYTYANINGVHRVNAVLGATALSINVNWGGGIVSPGPLSESGTTTYSDKRKTTFIDPVPVITDGTDYASQNANWTFFGPDGCSVEAGLFVDDSMKLVVPNVTCGSADQLVMNTAVTLIPGRYYTVKYRIDSVNDPSGEGYFVRPKLGGAVGSMSSGVGNKSEVILCGAGTAFEMEFSMVNANTGGFGTHSIAVKYISVELMPVSFEAYDWNAVIQYEEVPSFNWNKWWLGSTSSKFLTNQPAISSAKVTDRGSIAWLNAGTIIPVPNRQYFLVVTSETNGLPNLPYIHRLLVMDESAPWLSFDIDTSYRIIECGAYPWNLNVMSQADSGINVISGTEDIYTIQLYKLEDPVGHPTDYVAISEPKSFKMDYECQRYEPVRFMFLNSLGQYDYFNATLLSRTSINASRDTYAKTLPWNYTVGDRGKTTVNVNAQETYSIFTNFVDDETARWLSYEFFTSQDIYVLDNTTGTVTPINLDTNSIEVKKDVNDGLIQYEFNYSKAVPLNTIRG